MLEATVRDCSRDVDLAYLDEAVVTSVQALHLADEYVDSSMYSSRYSR
jgi:hypothetical protein